MSVRAIRGAVVERDDPGLLRDGVQLLIKEVMSANSLDPDALISIVFTATPDLVSAFPAAAARELGLVGLPLTCARELDVKGALPRTVRLLAHVESDREKSWIRHVYLGGAAGLRPDLAPRPHTHRTPGRRRLTAGRSRTATRRRRVSAAAAPPSPASPRDAAPRP